MSLPRFVFGPFALDDCEYGNCKEDERRTYHADDDSREAASTPSLLRHGAFCGETMPPAQDRARQDVVEDLPAARFVDSDDPVVAERCQDWLDIGIRDPGELRQVGDLVRNLQAGRRHEMVEQQRRDLTLRERQRLDSALKVVGDHLPRAS